MELLTVALLVFFLSFFIWWLQYLPPKQKVERKFDGSNLQESYDYIVVGAGSAGCVLAARLATNTTTTKTLNTGKKFTVLLVEAGDELHRLANIKKISSWTRLLYNDPDWDYCTIPQTHLNNRSLSMNRGKTTGGCSSINAVMWVRGNKEDYDNWNAQGWDWKSVLPIFKSLEDYPHGDPRYRGTGGPMKISISTANHNLYQLFRRAAVYVGYKTNDDYNGESAEGVGPTQENSNGKERSDCFSVFIEPLLQAKIPNLHVVSCAHTNRVLFDDKNKAIGVEIFVNGQKKNIKCNQEVILSAGSIGSPQLLMLSGIGPKEDLESLHIPVIVDNKFVGKNFHDHIVFTMAAEMKHPIENTELGSGFLGHLFWTSEWNKKNAPHRGPDMQTVVANVRQFPIALAGKLASLIIRDSCAPIDTFKGRVWRKLIRIFDKIITEDRVKNIFYFSSVLNQPNSKGSIKLRSRDPRDHPIIDVQSASAPEDIERLKEATHLMKQLYDSPPFSDNAKIMEFPDFTDATIVRKIKEDAFAPWHPVGSCKMGTGEDAVVDPKLRVKGVDRLRVADASIMPSVVSGNTNWASIMIGAKAADMILSQFQI